MEKKVEWGTRVSMHLQGKLENGKIFDSTDREDPIHVAIGSGLVLKSFEDALMGMAQGTKKTFSILPQDAYGLRDEALFITVDKSLLPEGASFQVGEIVGIENDGGEKQPSKIMAIHENTVELDLNHPLAGECLVYDVEILDIEDDSNDIFK